MRTRGGGLGSRRRRPLRRARAQKGVHRRRAQGRLPEARHDMAPGPVLDVGQLGARRGGQGALPGDPGRLLRALRLQQALPLRRRRLRHRRRRRGRPVGDGRLPRRDGRHDEPGHANGKPSPWAMAGLLPEYSRTIRRCGRSRPSPRALRAERIGLPYVLLQESFEELQQLFVDMFQDDLDPGLFTGLPPGRRAHAQSRPSTSLPRPSSSTPLRPPPSGRSNAQAPPTRGGGDKRSSPAMNSAKRPRPGWADLESDLGLSGFCFLVSETKQMQAPWACEVTGGGGERRSGRKQRLATSRDVSGDGMPRAFGQSHSSSSTALWQ